MAANQTQENAGSSLDLVDIKEIRDKCVFLKDGSLRQIVMVGGVNFSLKSDTEQTIITQAYQDFLNGVDFPLQIVIHSRKVNVDRYIQGLITRKENEASPLLKSQIDEYVEFIRGFVQKNAIMEKVFLVVVPFYPTGSGLPGMGGSGGGIMSSFPFFGSKKKSADAKAQGDTDKEKRIKESIEQLGQRTTQIVNGLISMGLEATILEDEQLVELFYNFYNPQTVERQDIAAQAPSGRL